MSDDCYIFCFFWVIEGYCGMIFDLYFVKFVKDCLVFYDDSWCSYVIVFVVYFYFGVFGFEGG